MNRIALKEKLIHITALIAFHNLLKFHLSTYRILNQVLRSVRVHGLLVTTRC